MKTPVMGMAKQTSTQLTGSAKQIAWALEIRERLVAEFERDILGANLDTNIRDQRTGDAVPAIRQLLDSITSASAWIDNRGSYEAVIYSQCQPVSPWHRESPDERNERKERNERNRLTARFASKIATSADDARIRRIRAQSKRNRPNQEGA
jgi:hypothetical protein